MKLASIFPSHTSDGSPLLQIYHAAVPVGECRDARWNVLIAASADGRTLFPISGQMDLFKPKAHVLIPATYKYFAETGMPHKDCYVKLDGPVTLPRSAKMVISGWLKGPIAEEVIRRSAISWRPLTENPPRTIPMLIRPWAYGDAVRPETGMEREAVRVWRAAARKSRRMPDQECWYTERENVILVPYIEPNFSYWARAYTEWLWVNVLSRAEKTRWESIIGRRPGDAWKLVVTYGMKSHGVIDEVADAGFPRIILAEAAALTVGDGIPQMIPSDMWVFVRDTLTQFFETTRTIGGDE